VSAQGDCLKRLVLAGFHGHGTSHDGAEAMVSVRESLGGHRGIVVLPLMLANLEIVPVHALPTDLASAGIIDQRRSLATASSASAKVPVGSDILWPERHRTGAPGSS